MNLRELDIRDNAVLHFLWQHVEPSDLRHDYNLLDAMREIERQVGCGDAQLWGDLEAGVMFRITVRNPKVIEPHIMGDGTKIRTANELGVEFAWAKGFEKIVIYTQHVKIARILERLGFIHAAHVPGIHLGESGTLEDIHILTMERPHAL